MPGLRSGSGADDGTEEAPLPRQPSEATVVAFFLPQYHRIAENDEWWGDGFTDWVNVRRARPLFLGHAQPRVPTSFGYYDLLDPEVHYAQASLARTHGIGAFCYYAYWFRGRRLLERPLDIIKKNPAIGMPYVLCWANETWSRRWDGSESQILIPQEHEPAADASFIDDVAEHLLDPRYVRIDGKPVILVYRPGILNDPLRATDSLRDRSHRLGIGELYLATVQSFGHWEPISYGFDAAVEFPPHNLNVDPVAASLLAHQPRGRSGVGTFQMADVVRISLSRRAPGWPWFRGVMPDWDNTPRRGARGTAYVGANPALFQRWLEAALEYTYLFHPPGHRLLFINAWNEWAEGAYLEPDAQTGSQRLEAVRAALNATMPLSLETGAAMTNGAAGQSMLQVARSRWSRSRTPGEFS